MYPYSFGGVEDHAFEDAALVGAEVALHAFDLGGRGFGFGENPATLALPAFDALGG